MSKKKNARQNRLEQGTIESLSHLEEMILQDEAADFSVSKPTAKDAQAQQQASELDELASLEGNLLQDKPAELAAQSDTIVDEDSLLDSIAELEDDFLYDELLALDLSADEVVAPVSEQPVLDDESPKSLPDMVTDLIDDSIVDAEVEADTDEADMDVADIEAVLEAESDLVADIETDAEATTPLLEIEEASASVFDERAYGGTGALVRAFEDEILAESQADALADELVDTPLAVDDDQQLEMSEAIEMAFTLEDEEVVDEMLSEALAVEAEETAVLPASDTLPEINDGWDALADIEADLLAETEDLADHAFAELSELETDFLHESDAVVEEAAAEKDVFEAFFAEAEAKEQEAAEAELTKAETAVHEAALVDEEEVEEEEETAVSSLFDPLITTPEADAQTAEELAFLAELEAEDHHFLDDLISSIDTELASARTGETMMDLAAPTAAEAQTLVQHVIFTLGNIRCAVPAVNIREVGEISYITPVPNVPDWLVGITSLRGDILSLVDLSTFLDLSSDKDMSLGVSDIEIMVVQSQQETLTAITTGLIVDEVDDIQDIPMEQVRVPTAALDNQLGTYMRGVYEDNGQMVVVLDLERLLMSPEMWQFEAI